MPTLTSNDDLGERKISNAKQSEQMNVNMVLNAHSSQYNNTLKRMVDDISRLNISKKSSVSIEPNNVIDLCLIEVESLKHTEQRFINEVHISLSLGQHIHSFDQKLNLIQFGSTLYKIGGNATNFNILISTGYYKLHSFDQIITFFF